MSLNAEQAGLVVAPRHAVHMTASRIGRRALRRHALVSLQIRSRLALPEFQRRFSRIAGKQPGIGDDHPLNTRVIAAEKADGH
jgi:hypothetical protein